MPVTLMDPNFGSVVKYRLRGMLTVGSVSSDRNVLLTENRATFSRLLLKRCVSCRVEYWVFVAMTSLKLGFDRTVLNEDGSFENRTRAESFFPICQSILPTNMSS